MHQGWLQIAGLAMDFAGVMLLAYEWLVSFRAQRAEEALADAGDREQKMLAFAQSSMRDERMAAHYKAVAARAQDRVRQQSGDVRRQGNQIRLPVFAVALMLVAAGFLLQIAGSWPGGMPGIGVLPN